LRVVFSPKDPFGRAKQERRLTLPKVEKRSKEFFSKTAKSGAIAAMKVMAQAK